MSKPIKNKTSECSDFFHKWGVVILFCFFVFAHLLCWQRYRIHLNMIFTTMKNITLHVLISLFAFSPCPPKGPVAKIELIMKFEV